MEPIIQVKGIGKKYNINHQKGGYITLRDILTNVFKNPFKFLKTKTKAILGIETKEEFWALRDINFEVTKGEVIGIIGRNGAGKSTLLKILSQITPPTTGEIRINGTVGSLLEVGTGFHPELTGRENIFLNGAILGMKKKDIVRKFDEIVKFADIEKFLDTPVKYYSSGMYVRLAFSVAAHMETDILIVDEVLAVGDAEFQKKCLGKMEDITQKEGKTIIFVSHNMEAIRNLCTKSILLSKGNIIAIGKTNDIIENYSESFTNEDNYNLTFNEQPEKEMQLTEASIYFNKEDKQIDSNCQIKLEIDIKTRQIIQGAYVTIDVIDTFGTTIYWTSDIGSDRFKNPKVGKTTLICNYPKSLLTQGRYTIQFAIVSLGRGIIFHEPNKYISFEIAQPSNSLLANYGIKTPGFIAIPSDWSVKD